MSRRMWILAVTAWVGVVIAGSALTWLAIDRAGQQVTASPTASSTQPPVVGTVGTAPTSVASPSSGPAPGGAPTNPPPATPSTAATPTQRATQQPGSTTTMRPAPSATKAPLPRTETRTWSGGPGFLTVSCTGAQATLKGASPADGWSFEHGDDSGDTVEVKFNNGQTEVQVHASCAGGVPQFHVETSAGGGGDG